MRLLFEMDKGDHANCTHSFTRNSARSIIIADGKIAMIHSAKYDYYKFPGGGIEKDEDPVTAMMRETREEAGLVIKPETVRAYGYVHRVQKSDKDASERFVQDNYYYLCEAEGETVSQRLEGYEAGSEVNIADLYIGNAEVIFSVSDHDGLLKRWLQWTDFDTPGAVFGGDAGLCHILYSHVDLESGYSGSPERDDLVPLKSHVILKD